MVMMTETILSAFSRRKPCEFQDIVLATPVLRIGAQHRECFGVDTSKFWRLSIEATEEAIELGDGTDSKR
jgi:hypothetical protein